MAFEIQVHDYLRQYVFVLSRQNCKKKWHKIPSKMYWHKSLCIEHTDFCKLWSCITCKNQCVQ